MDKNSHARYQQTLRQAGASLTKTRQLIFDLLYDQPPQSMARLLQRGRGQFDRVSLYRTINLFESLAIVQRLPDGWKYKLELSDLFAPHHHHLSCQNCHKLIDIDASNLEALILKLAKDYQFKPTRHQLEIQGYCQDCLNKNVGHAAE